MYLNLCTKQGLELTLKLENKVERLPRWYFNIFRNIIYKLVLLIP